MLACKMCQKDPVMSHKKMIEATQFDQDMTESNETCGLVHTFEMFPPEVVVMYSTDTNPEPLDHFLDLLEAESNVMIWKVVLGNEGTNDRRVMQSALILLIFMSDGLVLSNMHSTALLHGKVILLLLMPSRLQKGGWAGPRACKPSWKINDLDQANVVCRLRNRDHLSSLTGAFVTLVEDAFQYRDDHRAKILFSNTAARSGRFTNDSGAPTRLYCTRVLVSVVYTCTCIPVKTPFSPLYKYK